MNTVSEVVSMLRGKAEADGLSFIYGELWELNAGAERGYPCLLLEPLDSEIATIYKEHERFDCKCWLVDQILVTDQREREDVDDDLRAKAKAIIRAVRDDDDLRPWLHLTDGRLMLRSYTGQAGADNLAAIRIEFSLLIHDCTV